MLRFYKTLFAFIVFILFAFTSCKKDDNYVRVKFAEESVLYPEGIEDRDALLMAIRDYVRLSIASTAEFPVDLALAEFVDEDFKNVGQVKLNNDSLAKTSANFYVSNIDKSNYKLEPGNENQWSISGGNGFESFNKKLAVKMPAKIVFESLPSMISLSNDITLKVVDFPSNAQAIIWKLTDVDGHFIQKETITNELTLTAAELSKLSPGRNSLIKVAAYSLEKWENDGKKYVFVNEMVEMSSIEFK